MLGPRASLRTQTYFRSLLLRLHHPGGEKRRPEMRCLPLWSPVIWDLFLDSPGIFLGMESCFMFLKVAFNIKVSIILKMI